MVQAIQVGALLDPITPACAWSADCTTASRPRNFNRSVPMLPIHPLPPFKAARPLLMLGLAAGATALALWARRRAAGPTPIKEPRLIRVEPSERVETAIEVPWGTEVR
jgi:hypothetical protein